MTQRIAALGWILTLATAGVTPAQTPPTRPPQTSPERGDPTVRLPGPEARRPLDGGRLAVVRGANLGWHLINGATVVRDFGPDSDAAHDTCRAMRDLGATEWVTVGAPVPVLEYGLSEGRAAVGVPRPSQSVLLDATTRIDRLRGVWVLRTDTALVANFGPARSDAEQAMAAVKRYGFNRAGVIGRGRSTYLYFAGGQEPEPGVPSRQRALALASLGETLTRTGVNIPGTDDYVGERFVVEPRAVELKRDRSQFILAHQADVLAHFGPDEWAGRDALKAVQDGRFTEVCRVGGVQFFLSHGQAPTSVGLGTRRTRFEASELKVRPSGNGFALVEPHGARIATTATQAEAATLLRVIAGYGFDTLCECGGGQRGGLTYFARTGR